jgi:hypothetical protein
MIPRRVFPSLGPDHDFPSFGISVNRPLYFTDDLLGTLLRNAQNPRRIVHGHWPAVIDSDWLPHVLNYTPCRKRDFGWRNASSAAIRESDSYQGTTSVLEPALSKRSAPKGAASPRKNLVIPNRAESPVRACPELVEGNLLFSRRHHEKGVPHSLP